MSRPDHNPSGGPTHQSPTGGAQSISQQTTLSDLPLSAKAIKCLRKLDPFQDCVLVLDDARIPCHRVKLAEASTVLRTMLSSVLHEEQCQLQGEKVEDVAPLLELAYGGAPVFVDIANLEAVMYCHDKYDCRALSKAARAYMTWAERQTAVHVAIAVFKASSRFNHRDTFQKYGQLLAGVLPSLERCTDATVISGMASLEAGDVQFLKLKRLEFFEGFMEEVDWNLQPCIIYSHTDLETLSHMRDDRLSPDDDVLDGFNQATATVEQELWELKQAHGLMNEVVCVNGRQEFKFALFDLP